jgi:hypothetical protein
MHIESSSFIYELVIPVFTEDNLNHTISNSWYNIQNKYGGLYCSCVSYRVKNAKTEIIETEGGNQYFTPKSHGLRFTYADTTFTQMPNDFNLR